MGSSSCNDLDENRPAEANTARDDPADNSDRGGSGAAHESKLLTPQRPDIAREKPD